MLGLGEGTARSAAVTLCALAVVLVWQQATTSRQLPSAGSESMPITLRRPASSMRDQGDAAADGPHRRRSTLDAADDLRSKFLLPRQPSKLKVNFTLTGVVFYGRRHRTKVLNCYLERNLRSNGGLLNEVIFVLASGTQEDVDYLDQLILTRPLEYRKVHPTRGLKANYAGHYAWMDPSKLYVKMDDDLMYIADDAIELMLEEYLKGQYFLVSANVINHQPLVCAHEAAGAVHLRVNTGANDTDWWEVAPGHYYPALSDCIQDWAMRCWGDWRCAAGQHYSFLDRIRSGTLDAYKMFPDNRALWNFNEHNWYIRWRINLVVFTGGNIEATRSYAWTADDEDHITRILPEQKRRHSVAVGAALAVHFSYFEQQPGLERNTTLLAEYATLARQHCATLVEPVDKNPPPAAPA